MAPSLRHRSRSRRLLQLFVECSRQRPRSSARLAISPQPTLRPTLAAAAATPISDVRGTADYRRAMVAVITRRAIIAAVARARGEHVVIPASDSTFGAQS